MLPNRPLWGKNDLQNGTIRVLHNKSFVDDPTRILRGIRFEARYAFRMDKKTDELARASVEGDTRTGYSERTCTEMENVFRELVYTAILRRMEDLGLWRALFGTGKIPVRSTVDLRGYKRMPRERRVSHTCSS